jgi:hypothetical protein
MRTALLAALTAAALAVTAADASANAGPPRPRPTTKSTGKTIAGDNRTDGVVGWVVPGLAAALGAGLLGAWLLRRGDTRG